MNNEKEYPCLKRLDADCFKAQPGFAKRAFAYRLLHALAPPEITRRLPKGLRLAVLGPGIDLPPGVDLPPVIDPPNLPQPPDPGTGSTPPTYIEPWEPGPPRTPGGLIPGVSETIATVYGSTSDAVIYTQENTWDKARNNPTAPICIAAFTAYNLAMQGRFQIGQYFVGRSFLYFDLSAIPAGSTVTQAIVSVIGYFNALTQVSIQEGTQGDPAAAGDFNAYAGSAFDVLTWQKYVAPDFNPNEFTMDSAGLTYLSGVTGSTAKFCLREYTKDYLDVAPVGPGAANGMYYAEYFDANYHPYLQLTYK